MKTSLTLLLIVFFSCIYSQEVDKKSVEKYCKKIKFKTSSSFEFNMHRISIIKRGTIKLHTNPYLHFIENEDFVDRVYIVSEDSLRTIEFQPDIKVIDSIFIELHSGLKWELAQSPPEKVTKKGKCTEAYKNWQKYNEYCKVWKERNSFPKELIKSFDRSIEILKKGKLIYQIEFGLSYNNEGKLKYSKKELKSID